MNVITIDNEIRQYDRPPDVCPICHHAIAPRLISGTTPRAASGREAIQLAYQCTLGSCRQLFIASYDRPRNTGYYYLRSTAPSTPVKPDVSDEVAEVSPQFVVVLSQAEAAESYGLDQVAGVGYRKALEFIIKDYCIREHPSDADSIKAMFLGQVIDKYVDSANVKACAKRAAWLGNDETHYVRRWEDQDISDLKVLVKLTEGWIRDHLLTRKYLQDMQ